MTSSCCGTYPARSSQLITYGLQHERASFCHTPPHGCPVSPPRCRHSIKQKEMSTALFEAFHLTTTEEQKVSFKCLMGMVTADKVLASAKAASADEPLKMVFNLHGARLLEKLADFNSAQIKPLILSLIAIDGGTLKSMACDKDGSKVLEAFIKADIGDKRKKKLLKGLKGQFAGMAGNKFGSHVVDCCWAVAPVKTKEWIAAELLAEENTLRTSHFGKFVLRNCKIDYFKRKKDEWVDSLSANDKKRAMFSDFFDEDAEKAEKEKKSKEAMEAEQAAAAAVPKKVEPAVLALGFGKQIENDADIELGNAAETGRTHQLSGGDYQKDEIDDLFKEGSRVAQKEKALGIKKKKKKDSDEGEGSSKKKSSKSKGSKKNHGLDEVFDAIASTKKKKSKKRSREQAEAAAGEGKPKKSKKKKFMMS